NGQGGVAQHVVEVAADRSGLVDRQLEEVVAVGPFALNHGEHSEGKPFLLLARLGLLARVGDDDGLLSVLLLGANRNAVDVDGFALIDDVRAVVIVNRFGGIAAVRVAIVPGGRAPNGRRAGPRRRPPRAGITIPPIVVEAV